MFPPFCCDPTFQCTIHSFGTAESVDQDAMDATCLLVQASKLTLQGHLPSGWRALSCCFCCWDWVASGPWSQPRHTVHMVLMKRIASPLHSNATLLFFTSPCAHTPQSSAARFNISVVGLGLSLREKTGILLSKPIAGLKRYESYTVRE